MVREVLGAELLMEAPRDVVHKDDKSFFAKVDAVCDVMDLGRRVCAGGLAVVRPTTWLVERVVLVRATVVGLGSLLCSKGSSLSIRCFH